MFFERGDRVGIKVSPVGGPTLSSDESVLREIIAGLNAAGVPCGRVADLRDVFSDPQVLAQEMVLEVEHPGHGPVRAMD